MSEPKCCPTITSTAITHYGEWNASSRAIPALSFFEKYDAVVQTSDFNGPYYDWFAPSAIFYATTGATYTSRSEIWVWMKSPALFGTYSKLKLGTGSVVILGGHEKGDRLIHQQDMVFFPREGKEEDKGISVRRTIEFVSGRSEIEGQGTDGLQYFVRKTFWDTNILMKELARRAGL
jgi:hypothetical protein